MTCLVTTDHENPRPNRACNTPGLVIPTEVGIQTSWIPVFTGMTEPRVLASTSRQVFSGKSRGPELLEELIPAFAGMTSNGPVQF